MDMIKYLLRSVCLVLILFLLIPIFPVLGNAASSRGSFDYGSLSSIWENLRAYYNDTVISFTNKSPQYLSVYHKFQNAFSVGAPLTLNEMYEVPIGIAYKDNTLFLRVTLHRNIYLCSPTRW